MKLKKVVDRSPLFRPKRYTTVVMALIIFTGAAGSLFAAINTRSITRNSLMSRATTAAAALNVKDIQKLTGNDTDIQSSTYQDLRHRLTQIRSDNPDIRFVYLLGQRNNKIYFMVDSESEASKLHSPPGKIYPGVSNNVRGSFIISKAFIEGPVQDNYGNWLSAIVPIVDNSTGNTVALLGIDIPSSDYYWQIFVYSLVPLLLAAIPFAGLLRDRQLEAKEREITQLKTQFLSVASHELRSPLTGTLWAVQTLLKPTTNNNLTGPQTDLLTDIYSSTASSLTTVNEILDFSIFDRDKAIKLQHETVDLIPVLQEAQKMLRLSAKEADVKIVFSNKWPTLVETIGDVAALKRAFTNIIANAIKYSRAKTKVELVYHFQNGEHVIAVRDHGIGIPKSEQGRVLEGYYRATNALKVQSRGTGLGLWMTRLIIERHGGKLWLKSREGDGTIVFVALPTLDKPTST